MGYVGAAMAIIGTATSMEAREDQKAANIASREAQARIAAEQKAQNSTESARERRQQIREERVRRARIMQAAANTGTSESSGEFGALGGLATQLGSNIGMNLGKLQSATNLSIFGQELADAQGGMMNANNKSQFGQSLFSTGMSIGGASGWDFKGKAWT